MTIHSISSKCTAAGLAGVVILLAACAAPAAKKEERSGATVRSLNYSAREIFSIGVEMPGEPNSDAGGDALNPYSSGGMICCFSVPSVWRPDLKVVVEYKFYPETEYRKALVSIPPYPEGKASQIWLIVHEDESAEAVVSHYGPSRDEWPGKVKGYPVPSREYRLKLWNKAVSAARSEVAFYKKQLAEFANEDLEDAWKFRMEHKANDLKEFKGPTDPAFADYLKSNYKQGLDFYSVRLESLLKNKP